MSWRAKSSSYRENVASARRVNGAGKFGRHVKDARCPLHGGMTFYFSPRSLCESGMWLAAILTLASPAGTGVRETAEKQKFRHTEKVGYVLFIASNLLKTMVCQKIQKNVKYYFYIQQNWRGMVLRKDTLAVHWLLEDLLHACDDA